MLVIVRELEKQHKQHNSNFQFVDRSPTETISTKFKHDDSSSIGALSLTPQVYNSMEDFLNSSASGQYPPAAARIKNFKNYDTIYKK